MATRKRKAKTPKTKAKAAPKKKVHNGVTQGGNDKLSQKAMEQAAAKRRPEVHRLYLKGFNTRQIGPRFGVSHKTIANDLKIFRRELNAESLELAGDLKGQEDERRTKEDERLDDQLLLIHGILFPDPKKIAKGEKEYPTTKQVISAIEALGKVTDRRCRLWGLNGPVKLEKVPPRDGTPEERLMEALSDSLGEADYAKMLLAVALGKDPES